MPTGFPATSPLAPSATRTTPPKLTRAAATKRLERCSTPVVLATIIVKIGSVPKTRAAVLAVVYSSE